MRKVKDPELPFYREVGAAIRHLRRNAKGRRVSQSELALALNVKPNTVSRWESGNFRLSIKELLEIARYFEVPLESLIPCADTSTLHAQMSKAAMGLPSEELIEVLQYIQFRKFINRRGRKLSIDVDDH